jgi:hypothetical protein
VLRSPVRRRGRRLRAGRHRDGEEPGGGLILWAVIGKAQITAAFEAEAACRRSRIFVWNLPWAL